MKFRLSPAIDADALAAEFRRDGYVSVAPILAEECAVALHQALRAREDWVQVIGSQHKLYELDRATQLDLSDEQKTALDDVVFNGARYDFQYRYETIRVPDEDDARAASDDILARFAQWWSAGEARAMLRRIVGDDSVRFADAQATAFSPGDLLTGHDDAVEGKDRVAAYVLGLTPKWRVEWGGLLLMHHIDQSQALGLVPSFNRLNLFRVPLLHSVSMVTRATAYRRYSITGWLRR